MKNLAQLSIVLAVITLIVGMILKLSMSTVVGVGPIGLMKATMVFLLFGISFGLLELINKK